MLLQRTHTDVELTVRTPTLQEQVLAEANMMIPNTTQRLSSALEDLNEVKVNAAKTPTLSMAA